MKDEIRQTLIDMGENKYGDFQSVLVPGKNNIIGVRIPKLREYAKRLAKEHSESALEGEDIYYEEVMLRGLIIGYLKTDTNKRLRLIEAFVPLIDNWAVCDTFCSTLRFTDKNREVMWNFLQPYIRSEKEFYARFGAVMLLDYYISEEYIDRTLTELSKINTAEYYSSMAVAWAVAECYIKFPDRTEPYIVQKIFDKDTHNRAIQKICDSFRVDSAKKIELKGYRINGK